MIFKHLFPPRYGGAMKRYARFQKTMSKKRWRESDVEKNGPITLYDFSILDDAVDAARVDESNKKGGWRISDDSVIGGYSHATFQMIRTVEDYKRVMAGDLPVPFLETIEEVVAKEGREKEEEAGKDGDDPVNDFVPFARWKGTIDTTVNNTKDKKIQRSGFCAIRSPEFPFSGANLDGRYDALEIICRSDGRPYSVHMRIESFIPDDVYQCFINIPATIPPEDDICPETGGRFDQVILPFRDFIVTSGGRVKATQRELDSSVKFQSIGLTLMDGVDGNFQFDLARIRAVNFDERGVIGVAN